MSWEDLEEVGLLYMPWCEYGDEGIEYNAARVVGDFVVPDMTGLKTVCFTSNVEGEMTTRQELIDRIPEDVEALDLSLFEHWDDGDEIGFDEDRETSIDFTRFNCLKYLVTSISPHIGPEFDRWPPNLEELVMDGENSYIGEDFWRAFNANLPRSIHKIKLSIYDKKSGHSCDNLPDGCEVCFS
jgi:hypothetical protein